MTIELPKDAEGREIPLDTRRLYNKNGERKTVLWFEYSPTLKHWTVVPYEGLDVATSATSVSRFYLTPPDSWKMLEEDLDKCIAKSGLCRYYSPSGQCRDCAISDNEECGCTAVVFKDIKKRIRKLRGESDV